MIRSVAAALAFIGLCAAHATAAPVHVAAPMVSSYSGVKIVTQNGAENPLIGVQLFIRAGLDRQTTHENGLAALVAQSIVQTAVAGSPLRDAVLAQGGSISYIVDGRWVRFYIEGVSSNFGTGILPLVEAALRAPDFSVSNVAAARGELQRRIAQEQKVPLEVGLQMLNTAFFTQSNAGLPQFGLSATLAGFTASQAAAFFAAQYRRGGALLSADGGLDQLPAGLLEGLVEALPVGSTQPAVVNTEKLAASSRRLVTHRDITAPWLVAQFRAPGLQSRDFGAMLVLASLLERTTAQVAENPSVTTRPFAARGVGTIYNFDENPASLVLYINGGFGDPSRAFGTALAVIAVFARSNVAGDIASLKREAAGSYIEGMNTLDDRAWLAGVFALQNVSPDYVQRGLDAIAAVKAADLQRVARAYLDHPNVAVVLPRDAPT